MLLWRRMNVPSDMPIVHTGRKYSIEALTPRVDGVYGFLRMHLRMPHFQITAFLMRFIGNRGGKARCYFRALHRRFPRFKPVRSPRNKPQLGLSWTLLPAAKGAKRVATSDNGMDLTKRCSQKGELKCSSLP